MSVGKQLRFEVFKRDKFTCQYCGRSAPDVLLQVDHIQPVSKEGSDDILNLITSCRDCNLGKSNRELSDDTAVVKRKRQLDELQERREQLDMMLEWQKSLTDMEDDVTEGLADLWRSLTPGFAPTPTGIQEIRRMVGRFGAAEVAEAMRISARQYLVITDGLAEAASVGKAFDYIGRICTVRRTERENPNAAVAYRIRSYLKRNLSYFDDRSALRLLFQALDAGYEAADLWNVATGSRNWSTWRQAMEQMLGEE